jgi:hypothetical protein
MIQILRGILYASASVFLAVGAWLVVETIFHARAITAATVANENAIAQMAAAVPGIVDSRLAAIQTQTLGLVDQHMTRIEATVNGAVRVADKRLAGIQAVAAQQLGDANQSIESIATISRAASSALPVLTGSVSQALGGIAADVHQVTTPAASLAAQLNDAAPLYLDCDSGNCLFNHIQGISRSIDLMTKEIAKAAPQMADSAVKIEGSAASISKSVDREVTELTKPKRWWNHVEDFAKVGIMGAARLF